MPDWPKTLPEMAEFLRISTRTFQERIKKLREKFPGQTFFVSVTPRVKLFYPEHHDMLKEFLPQLLRSPSAARHKMEPMPSPDRAYKRALKRLEEAQRRPARQRKGRKLNKVVSLDDKRK